MLCRTRWLAPFLSSCVLVAGLGCGGSSSGDSSAGTYTVGGRTYTVEASTTMDVVALSRAQFTARINRACRERWPRIRKFFVEYTALEDPKLNGRERFDEAVRESLLNSIDFHIFDSIHMLGAPKGERGQIEEMIGALQLTIERGQKLHIYSLDQLLAQFAAFNRQARAHSLDDCLINPAHLRFGVGSQ